MVNAAPSTDEEILRAEVKSDELDTLLAFSVLRTHNLLAPHLDRNLQDLKLTSAQFNVLLLLHAEPDGGLPLGEIGRKLVVTKANITGLIDRLEQKGLVYRDAADDRRVTVARLTPEGAQLADRVIPRHQDALGDLLDCLAPGEKRSLIDLLTKLRRGVREKFRQQGCGA